MCIFAFLILFPFLSSSIGLSSSLALESTAPFCLPEKKNNVYAHDREASSEKEGKEAKKKKNGCFETEAQRPVFPQAAVTRADSAADSDQVARGGDRRHKRGLLGPRDLPSSELVHKVHGSFRYRLFSLTVSCGTTVLWKLTWFGVISPFPLPAPPR